MMIPATQYSCSASEVTIESAASRSTLKFPCSIEISSPRSNGRLAPITPTSRTLSAACGCPPTRLNNSETTIAPPMKIAMIDGLTRSLTRSGIARHSMKGDHTRAIYPYLMGSRVVLGLLSLLPVSIWGQFSANTAKSPDGGSNTDKYAAESVVHEHASSVNSYAADGTGYREIAVATRIQFGVVSIGFANDSERV